MSNIIQEIIFKVSSDAEDLRKGVGQVDDKVKETKKSTGGLQNQFKKLLPALGVAAIVAGFKKIATASLQAADVQAKAEQKLLTAANGRIGVQQKLIKQAQDLQKVTTFGDEQTIEAQARLLPLLNGNADAVEQLIPLIQDLSVFTGMDLASAADLVGKSVGSSTNALSRYGIQIEGAVGSSERLESAIASLNSRAGGQAASAAQVGLGAWQQFKNLFGDLSEEFGFLLINVLNPLFDGLKRAASSAIEFVNGFRNLPKEQEKLSNLRGEMNLTFNVLKSGNLIQESRNKLIDEVNKKYGEYLPNLLDEKSTIEDIEAAQAAANKQLLFKISLLDFEEERNKILEEQAARTDFLVQGQINYNKQLEELKAINASPQAIAAVEQLIKSQEEQQNVADDILSDTELLLADLEKKYKGIADVLGVAFEDFFGTGEDLGGAVVDGIVKGAEDKAKEVDMAKVARELQLEFFESLSEFIKDAAPELKAELENALQIKLGIDTEESIDEINNWVKENKEKTDEVDFEPKIDGDEIVKGIDQILRASKDLIDSLGISERVENEINELDELIAKQQEVVDSTRALAEQGNANQLKLEEERLQQLQAQQDEALKRKEKNAKAEIALNKSLALSQSIVAIASAAKDGASALVMIPLILSALAAGIATATSLTSSSFYEGTEDTGRGGKLDSKGGFAAVLHPNERVMTAKQNKRIKQALGNVSNDDLVKMIENSKSLSVNPGGLLVDSSAINEKMNTKMDEMISLNREMLKAMKRNGVNVSIDKNGLSVMMHQMVQRQNILNNL